MITKLHIPMRLRKRGAALIDQQLWSFGRDIFHPDGNALWRYGLQCHRVPDNHKGCNAYVHALSATQRMTVWGFGVFYGDDALGGVFLKRYQFSPQFTAAAQLALPLWKVDQMPSLTPPRNEAQVQATLMLASAALVWLSEYERWVMRTLGSGWREACLKAWHRKASVPAPEMADAWLGLSAQLCDNANVIVKRPTMAAFA